MFRQILTPLLGLLGLVALATGALASDPHGVNDDGHVIGDGQVNGNSHGSGDGHVNDDGHRNGDGHGDGGELY